MKKVFTIAALLSATVCFGQQFTLQQSTQNAIKLKHEVQPTNAQHTVINGESHIDYTKSHQVTSMEAGAPAVPFFTESVIVPNEGKVTLDITYGYYTDYPNVSVAPSKGSLTRNISPSSIPYTFGAAYNTNEFYPGSIATMNEPYNIRNTRGATVSIYPYQYNPVTKVLRVYEDVRVTVVTDENEVGINELTTTFGQNDVFSEIYHHQYLNSDLVFGRYTPLEESGDMLIITDPSFTDEIEPLVRWKIETGMKTTVVTTNDAGSNDSQIKSYIESFYASNPNLVYVLLVGDHSDVPSHTYGTSGWGESLWSDSYYGMLQGNDFYPEIFVGRFFWYSCSNHNTS